MDNFPRIAFKDFEGWIPETDTDGVDTNPKFLSDINAMRFNNGFIENNVGISLLTLPSNVSNDISNGYSLKSSFNFTHSIQGEKTIYILWKGSASTTTRLKLYLDNNALVLGSGTDYIYSDEPNNINYNVINDEVKINLNCNATFHSKNVILNLSLQYLDEVIYNSTNNIKWSGGWYICPRWLGWQHTDSSNRYMYASYEITTESFEDNQPNHWLHMQGLSSLVNGWNIHYSTNVHSGSYCLTTNAYDSYIKLVDMRSINKIKFWAKDDGSGDDTYITIKSEDGSFIASFLLTTTYTQYECEIRLSNNNYGTIYIYASYRVNTFSGSMSQVYLDDISFYTNDENVLDLEDGQINSILIAKYSNGERALIETSKYSISQTASDNRLNIQISEIDWRIIGYEIYQNVDNIYILYKELNIDNNWAYDVVYAYRLFSIDINDTTLDFRYNLPYNIRVDNQSLIYMEVSHKGRVYYIKEDFKVYQSHIAGNGIIQPDSFPYDEQQGFGYFVVSRSRQNIALAVSPTNDLVVFTNSGFYVYFIQPSGSTVYRQLRMVSGSVGICSRKSLAVNSEGNPATQGLMWCDNNGVYYYSGGITEPTNLLLPAHVQYWRNISSSHKASIVGFYDNTRYEYSFEVNQILFNFEIPYKRFRISNFVGVNEVVGFKNNVLYLRVNDLIYQFIDNEYSEGYFTTHYNSAGDELDDKITQEIYVLFGKDTSTEAEIILYVYIDNDKLIGQCTLTPDGLYCKRLLPIRRFRRVKVKCQINNPVKTHIREIGISYAIDKLEAVGVLS